MKNLGFVVPNPALIGVGDFVFVPKGAKNPYAAMLWIHWSISDEGLNLLDEVQFTGDPTLPGATSYNMLKGKKVVRAGWEDQTQTSEIVRSIVSAMGLPVAR